jgi:hypothetical protein
MESRADGGATKADPIRLLTPQVVAMTAAQREAAIQSLAVVLDSWLNGRTYRSDAREGPRQPKTRSHGVPDRGDGAQSGLQ